MDRSVFKSSCESKLKECPRFIGWKCGGGIIWCDKSCYYLWQELDDDDNDHNDDSDDESEEVELPDVTSVAIICDKSLMMMITMITMVTMMKVRRWYNQWQEWLLSDVTRVATYYLWQEELLQVGPILASVTPSVCATFHALTMMMILDWRSTKPRCVE